MAGSHLPTEPRIEEMGAQRESANTDCRSKRGHGDLELGPQRYWFQLAISLYRSYISTPLRWKVSLKYVSSLFRLGV